MMLSNRLTFGPVPSRRLGRSLGVDLVPMKTCSFDCVYCQLGRTTRKTQARRSYVSFDAVVGELAWILATGVAIDCVTLSGSGEPTLHRRLGDVIRAVRDMTDTPVAVLTNGSMLCDAQVRRDCGLADVVLPTLAAVDQRQYERIHRPCEGMRLERHLVGIHDFRQEFDTPIWLELFLVKGVNTAARHLARFREIIHWLKPDRVQINTTVRPAPGGVGLTVPRETLEEWARQLGPNAEVIAGEVAGQFDGDDVDEDALLELCRRRPCTLDDLAAALRAHRHHVAKHLARLLQAGRIESKQLNGRLFYRCA